MTHFHKPQLSFNSGEVSPLLYGRTDYKRVRTGVRSMRGFIPLRGGGFTRAPGTIFRGYTKDNRKARLIPFKFNTNDSLLLEFSDQKMRVWRYGAAVESGGSPYEISVVYKESELDAIWPLQSADVIYIADGLHPMQKLSRFDLDNWSISEWQLDTGPFMVQNLDEGKTIRCSGTTGSISLTGSGGPFDVGQVGALLMLKPVDITDIPIWTGNTVASIGDLFRYDDRIYKLTAGNADPDIKTGVTPPVHIEGEQLYDKESGATYEYISDLVGIVRITSVNNSNSASATVLKTIPKPCTTDATYRWSEGAWSGKHGYPAAIENIKQRIVAGGVPTRPRELSFSAIGDFNDFYPGSEADSAFAYNIDGSEGQNGIKWLRRARKGIYVGTLGEVIRGFSSQAGQAIGVSTFDTDVEGVNGSIAHRPIAPFGYPIYITADGTRVEEARYSFEVDGGDPIDLTTPAEHIGDVGFREIVWQSRPLGLSWLRRADGDLVLMLYDPKEEVLGWAEVPVAGGFVESLAVSSSEDGSHDVLTMVVRREVNGSTVRMIEEFAPIYGVSAQAEPIHKAVHLYSSSVFELEVATDTFAVPHLIGQKVYAWTDQGQFGPITVPASGNVTIDVSANHAVIGLFDATHAADLFQPAVEEQEGDGRGFGVSIGTGGAVVLHRTAAGNVRGVERHFGQPDIIHKKQLIFDVSVAADLTEAHSGVATLPAATGEASECSYRFEPEGAAPMTVLAVVTPIETGGA